MNSDVRLCAIVVIYGQKYSDSYSFKSLVSVAQKLTDVIFDVVIYDNSPHSQTIVDNGIFNKLIYYHDSRNIGVIPAYLFAKSYCRGNGIDWLLRLDQDSVFQADLVEEFKVLSVTHQVKVIIPKVMCKGGIISPTYVKIGGIYKSIPKELFGWPNKKVTFINSMSFLKVGDEMISNGLESVKCQLDLSDHEFARALPNSSIYIMKTIVSHSLSIKEKGYVSKERYENILLNEIDFVNRSENILGRFVFLIRLLFRSCKFIFNGKKGHAFITIIKVLNIKWL